MPQAWIVTTVPQEKSMYDATPLATFQKVPELWDESGNTYIYLHGRDHARGASFKIDSTAFSSSRKLSTLAHGGAPKQHLQTLPEDRHDRHGDFEERMQKLSLSPIVQSPRSPRPGSSRASSYGSRDISDSFDQPKLDIHLSLPQPLQADLSVADSRLTTEDIETLLAVRNVFAFLTDRPLVATNRYPSLFAIFLRIADILQRYEFSNLDGSTLGEEVETNFKRVIEEFGLADVRVSREKTIEAVVLGERMRSWELYNEGFVHLVGKHDEIIGLKSNKYHLVTEITRKRMERATLDLATRLNTVRTRLETFDFPSLFAGSANSKTSDDSKLIRFKAWKISFVAMRRHVISLYKQRYGAWPPSARSKKNNFEESGLNRLLLFELYQDFSDLYDTLVDRSSITSRSMEVPSQDTLDSTDPEEPSPRALRRVMSEYDRSTPPVQPPIPYDTPLLPSLASTRRDFTTLNPRKQKKESMKRLRDDEINQCLMQSYNRESIKATPFLQAFMAFERRAAHGKSIEEMAELRNGQWIFMYAVLQSLPLIVIDAPGIRWTKGVEYFLCEVPKGAIPWSKEAHKANKNWYGIAGGTGLVSLPSDVVDHGVEGIYRRSHCWEVAQKWGGGNNNPNDHDFGASPASQLSMPYEDFGDLPAPPPLLPGSRPASRSSSPGARSNRDSMSIGLEALPLPAGVAPNGSRPSSMYDPTKSFDAILGPSTPKGKRKR